MTITIRPLSPERLSAVGDIETELRIPYDPDEDRFDIAFADGTLVTGEYDPEEDRFHFEVAAEGAGEVGISGEEVRHSGPAAWLTIGIHNAPPRPAPAELPLFDFGRP